LKPRRRAKLRAYLAPSPVAPGRGEFASELPRTSTIYDDGLLDRARDLWRQGDWHDLVQLPWEQVESHPQAGRIALILAAAHLALGNAAQTRQLVHMARQLGVDENLVSRVLLAGVHNTLGRAAAAGGRFRDQAIIHFRAALEPSGGYAASRTLLQGRVRQQMASMSVPGGSAWVLGFSAATSQASSASAVPALERTIRMAADEAAQRVIEKSAEQQPAALAHLGQQLEKAVHSEIENAVRQLESYQNLQGYLTSGELLPDLHGWPVSPDFALLLIQLLEQNVFDVVVEFGSGSSTVLMSKTLEHIARKRPGTPRPVQIAFEHLPKYHAATLSLLRQAGTASAVQVVLSPLVPTKRADGEIVRYYDIGNSLQQVAADMASASAPRVLAVIDGPPESVGPLARYPALEHLLAAFPRQHGTLLLDDYRRPGEQEAAQRWCALLRERGIEPTLESLPLEKQAALIRFDSATSAMTAGSPLP
jgi:hypothetical protein